MSFVFVNGFSKFKYLMPSFVSIIKAKIIRKEGLQKFKDILMSGYRNCSLQFQA